MHKQKSLEQIYATIWMHQQIGWTNACSCTPLCKQEYVCANTHIVAHIHKPTCIRKDTVMHLWASKRIPTTLHLYLSTITGASTRTYACTSRNASIHILKKNDHAFTNMYIRVQKKGHAFTSIFAISNILACTNIRACASVHEPVCMHTPKHTYTLSTETKACAHATQH